MDSGETGLYSSLALDAAGCPRISYFDSGTAVLKYAWRDCVTQGTLAPWHVVTIDGAGYAGWDTSLALDNRGWPHIAYTGVSGLKYAWQDSSGWHTQTVDDGDSGYGTSLALDAADRPYISYHDITNGDLKCAHPCIAVTGAQVAGPHALLVDQEGTYRAAALPVAASIPVSYIWSDGTAAPVATYSWAATGTFTVTVTATNACGWGTGVLSVRVLAAWPFAVYLPLVGRP